jgi:hypothetical protein
VRRGRCVVEEEVLMGAKNRESHLSSPHLEDQTAIELQLVGPNGFMMGSILTVSVLSINPVIAMQPHVLSKAKSLPRSTGCEA